MATTQRFLRRPPGWLNVVEDGGYALLMTAADPPLLDVLAQFTDAVAALEGALAEDAMTAGCAPLLDPVLGELRDLARQPDARAVAVLTHGLRPVLDLIAFGRVSDQVSRALLLVRLRGECLKLRLDLCDALLN